MKRLGLLFLPVVLAACSLGTNNGNSAGGDGGQCAPALGTSPSGCPDTHTAESAFGNVQSACNLTNADVDTTDPNSPTLTAAAQPKVCATCACRTAIFAYETLYKNCTASDQQNAAFAGNLYALATACK